MAKEIKLPEISENIHEAEVVEVLVSEGDQVKKDQAVAEMETEKSIFEIPSPSAGKITELAIKKGDTVKVGDLIARLDTEEEVEEEEPPETEKTERKREKKQAAPEEEEPTEPEEEPKEPEAEPEEEKEKEEERVESGKEEEVKEVKKQKESEREEPERGPAPAAPSVRRLAAELGIEIHDVRGSGPGGRITRDDVKSHTRELIESPAGQEHKRLPDFSQWGPVHREPMSKVRRITAESMSYSWRTVPHVTQFSKADVTSAEEFRKKNTERAKKEGGKLTLTSILIKLSALALQRFPRFGASLDEQNQELIYKDYIHIGFAVDTDRGLLVPVIRDADKKDIYKLSAEVSGLAEKAKNKKISPDEMEGGCFTVSNLGGIGGTNFTPIVYAPQAAVLGADRAEMMPVYENGEFHPRLMLPLSLSYDHRIIDGADGARFMQWMKNALENPLSILLEGE